MYGVKQKEQMFVLCMFNVMQCYQLFIYENNFYFILLEPLSKNYLFDKKSDNVVETITKLRMEFGAKQYL